MKFDAGLFYRKKYITQKEHVVKKFYSHYKYSRGAALTFNFDLCPHYWVHFISDDFSTHDNTASG